jgi:Domain of unknown function (DUF4189)
MAGDMIGARHLLLMAAMLPALTIAGGEIAFAAGAFAFGQKPGPTGWSSGSAYNRKTTEDAQSTALTRCQSRKEAGDYCKVITTINGKCFAIAIQESGNGYGWNTASTLPEAQQLALNRCTGYGKSCTVRESFCDTATTTSSASPPAATPAPTAPPAATPSANPGGGGSPACQKFPDLC